MINLNTSLHDQSLSYEDPIFKECLIQVLIKTMV